MAGEIRFSAGTPGGRESSRMARRRTVLVVDDEPHIRLLITTVLEQRGLRTLAAAGGHEGLETVRSARPDLILLDWAMPGMGGEEFLARLDSLDTSVPVMVVTGSAQGEMVSAHRRVADFLPKPFDVWELAERVERLLAT